MDTQPLALLPHVAGPQGSAVACIVAPSPLMLTISKLFQLLSARNVGSFIRQIVAA